MFCQSGLSFGFRTVSGSLKVVICLGLLMAGITSVSAQTQAQLEKAYSITGTIKVANNGATMYYRLLAPSGYKTTQKYPLVLLLHGGGESGTDNKKQLAWEIAKIWMSDSVQKKWAPFVVIPQSPNTGWSNVNGDGAIKLVDSLAKAYPIDTTRLYVGGHSMGGFGTFYLMHKYPNKFAAALPCAGGGDNKGDVIAKTAFWALHGDADPTVNVSGSRTAIKSVDSAGFPVVKFYCSKGLQSPTGISLDSLKKAIAAGRNYLYTEIKGGDHSAGCDEQWKNPLMPGWIFSKAKVDGKIVQWPLATGIAQSQYTNSNSALCGIAGTLRFENGSILWTGSTAVQVTLFAANGTKVLSQLVGRNTPVSSHNLTRGMYCAEVKTTMGNTVLQKIPVLGN